MNGSASETDTGPVPSRSTLRSPEKPMLRSKRRMRRSFVARTPTEADVFAALRARIATAFDAIRRAREAIVMQEYAAKLAGLSLCLPASQIGAAIRALAAEREAAIQAVRREVRDMEAAEAERVRVVLFPQLRPQRPAAPPRPGNRTTGLPGDILRRPVTAPVSMPIRPVRRLRRRFIPPPPQRG